MAVRILSPVTRTYGSTELLVQVVNQLEQVVPTTRNVTVCWASRRPDLINSALNARPRISGLAQLQAFKDANVPTVQFTTNLHTAMDWVAAGKEVWGRNCYHTMAKDIVPYGDAAWWTKDFWVLVVQEPFDEWRIHVVKGRAVGRGKKIPTGPHVLAVNAHNRRNGWTMRHDINPPAGMRAICKAAVAACRYDFAAVDIIHIAGATPGQDRYFVLEANRAPALSDYTANAYAKAFHKLALEGRLEDGEE